jgi:SSS family solute:Na+ symporter
MHVTHFDWAIAIGIMAVQLVVCGFFIRRAGKGISEFFVSGRSLPWWLVGTSMVATTFSADTPNLVTDIVRQHGVAGNWVWWAFLLTGMMTVFFYARLWRRSGVLTDLEFYEIRYSGKSAAVVRGFRALYLGLFFNCVIMASVTLAAVKIASVMLGWPAWQTILWCTAISLALTVSAGLWGVVVTDLLQFIVAMTGAFVAAYYAVHNDTVGGLSGLLSKLGQTGKLDMIPDLGNTEVALSVLIIPLVIQWWSTWYPGAEPGGGSYIAQRMLAAKNEKHSMGAMLWFNVAHYALRPWPWIIVGLASLVVYPQLSDIQAAFPQVSEKLIGHDIAYPAMLKFMPAGMLGLMLGSLMAAYFSTMSTHLNWGASYLVHDFYQRFIKTNGSQKHYVLVSRIVTTALMLLAALTVPLLTSAKDSFDLMLSIGAGTGLIYLLRWFWWRINAWSEVAAMISSFTISLVLFFGKKYELGGMERLSTHLTLAASVGFTSLVWIAVTLLTRPTEHGVLVRFYRLTRPFGPGWRHIQRETGLPASPDSVPQAMLGWVLSVMMVYAAMFGTGNFIYGNLTMGIVFSAVFLASAIGVGVILGRVFSKPLIEDHC